MLDEPLPRFEALRLARRIFVAGEVSVRRHARERMAERNVTMADIENIIRCGYINREGEEAREGFSYTVETSQMWVAVGFTSETVLRIISVGRKS